MKKSEIAKVEKMFCERFDLETLDTRMSDSLDFVECSVWGLREMIEKIYAAGFEAGAKGGR